MRDLAEKRPKILVVDDEVDVRDMIEAGLCLDGYQVRTARGGEDAVDLVRAEEVDLIITDFKMPGMSGVETVTRIREMAPDLPVIVVTGYLTPSSMEQCLALGKVTFIRKPFEFETLTAAVQAAIGPARAQPSETRLEW